MEGQRVRHLVSNVTVFRHLGAMDKVKKLKKEDQEEIEQQQYPTSKKLIKKQSIDCSASQPHTSQTTLQKLVELRY